MLSKTVRLDNEDLGGLQRRANEIARRIEEGTIELPWVMAELQRIVEGRKLPEVRYRSSAEPLEFSRPPKRLRRTSAAPYRIRLPHSLQRLKWPERDPEKIMVELWEAECIPRTMINCGRTYINAIMGNEIPTERDIQVINSTLQWLATKIGQSFLIKFLRVSQIWIT